MEALRQLWGYPLLRFKIPVGVAYGSDLRLVERLLLQVARENPDVLDDPAPVVRLMAFGDRSALRVDLIPIVRTPRFARGTAYGFGSPCSQ
jgi:small-conductance mechanosensitive channel